MVAAWKLDPVYCSSIKVGVPQVSLPALSDLHRLLTACESQLLSANGNTVTQEDHDGIAATARPSIGTHSEAEACSTGAAPPARPRCRAPEIVVDHLDVRETAPARDIDQLILAPLASVTAAQRQAVLEAVAQLLLEASGAVTVEGGDDDA